jgi:hypothetical protein
MSKRFRPGDWVFTVFSPLLVFPVYLLTASLFDWFTGNAFTAVWVLHESWGQLLRVLATDWIASLPLSVSFAWLLLLAVYLAAGSSPAERVIRTLLAGLLVGVAAGIWLFHTEAAGLLIAGITGGLLSMCLLCWQWMLSRRETKG